MTTFYRGALLAATAIICGAGPVCAQKVTSFDVAAQPVGTALATLAGQADIQILAAQRLTQGKMSRAVRGSMTVAQGLARLLEGTGLQPRQLGPSSFTIVAGPNVRDIDTKGAERPIAADSVASEDIVVTANKRPENVQDVAASITVLSAAKLQERKLEQLSDYIGGVPGVSARTLGTPGQTSLTIRGIAPLAGGGSKVATYIDDSPLGSSGIWGQAGTLTLDLLPFDLDRLELLRGPQGTLYGAGSMGGLLKYVLTTPDTKALHLDASADLGDVAHSGRGLVATVAGRLNIPIVKDVLGVSVSGFYKDVPGYIDDAYTGAKDVNSYRQYGGRFAAFARPAGNLTVKLNAFWQHTDSDNNAYISLINPTEGPASTTTYRLVSGGTSLGRLVQRHPFRSPFTQDLKYGSGAIDWDLGPFKLVSATSYSRTTADRQNDFTYSYGTYYPLLGLPEGLANGGTTLKNEKFTQEVRLQSDASKPIFGQIGVFYTHERQDNVQDVRAFDVSGAPIAALAPSAGHVTIPTRYREISLFGELTWKISDRFDVSGGLRYAHNRQLWNLAGSGALLGLPQTPLTPSPAVRSSENVTTWMASGRYHFTPDIMAYVRVATGFAPGGANSPLPGIPQATVGSETLTSYEGGLKTELFGHHALIDVSVYHIDWTNIQLAAEQSGIGYTTNGGKAFSEGFEVASVLRPARGLSVGLNAGYTRAELTSLNPFVSTPFILHAQLPVVPKWNASATVDYSWPVGHGWQAHAGGGLRWTAKFGGTPQVYGADYYVLPASTIVDLNASITRNNLTIRLYVKNLTDTLAYGDLSTWTGLSGAISQLDYAVIQPRTIGAAVVVHF